MYDDIEKNAAARCIQRFWRKCKQEKDLLEDRAKEISEWNGLVNITERNNQLMEKLTQLRISKNYDMQKFEKLIQLPPEDISEWIMDENKKTHDQKMIEMDCMESRYNQQRQDRAARIIQKFFKQINMITIYKQEYRRINNIKPKRRLQLLDEINDRLNERRLLRRLRADDVIRSLITHKNERDKSMKSLAQLMSNVRRHDRGLSRPNTPCNVNRMIPELAKVKAQKKHEERMNMSQLEILDILLDGHK